MAEILGWIIVVGICIAWERYDTCSPNSRRNRRYRWWTEAENENKKQVKRGSKDAKRR